MTLSMVAWTMVLPVLMVVMVSRHLVTPNPAAASRVVAMMRPTDTMPLLNLDLLVNLVSLDV